MDITITPHKLCGKISAISSKSQAHRLLICAAFADKETILQCTNTNQDIEATASCLRSLGARITRSGDLYRIIPIGTPPSSAKLHCRESGSTLRFLLPIVGALGVDTEFYLEGRLAKRPLSPLWEEMERNGCSLSRPTDDTIQCKGKLRSGAFTIAGGVSSQFITGLLFAAVLMDGASQICITGKIESLPYINMTLDAMDTFGVKVRHYSVPANTHFITPGNVSVEGDWSNGAFFLCANALGNKIDLTGLNINSAQGDRAVSEVLSNIDCNPLIDAADIPDLVPILAVTGGAKRGITFTNIRRLRLKESDRVATVCSMLEQLGSTTESTENTLTVFPAEYHGCSIDSAGDHRIAMAAAIAATVATGPVKIIGGQCVAKSYPEFWNDYRRLGGQYEQHIR